MYPVVELANLRVGLAYPYRGMNGTLSEQSEKDSNPSSLACTMRAWCGAASSRARRSVSTSPLQPTEEPSDDSTIQNESAQVVRVAGEAVAPAFELLVQIVKDYVGQQRRKRTALRHALDRSLEPALDLDACAKALADKAQDALIVDPSRQGDIRMS